jgi:SulP family sulfate permease
MAERPPPLAAASRWLRSVRPRREDLRADTLAGLPGAISSVPDGMAAAVLVGVSPIYGLYATFAGPIAGGVAASTRLMLITTTGAAALAAGSAVQDVPADDRAQAVALLALLAGVVMIAAGLARLGRYTRFVSHSVMIGFLTGVAVNIIAGQIPDLTGAPAEGSFALAKAVNVLTHPGRINGPTLACGLTALALMVALGRTRLSVVSALVAVLLPTVVVAVVGADSVALVSDAGAIPTGIPAPALPGFDLLSLKLLTGVLAVAAIVLVQGAGVSQSAPNRDGPAADANQDFAAQGVANVASGLFRGIAVGGSVGQTALNIAAGARSRWASIISGAWMLAILVLFGGVVGDVVLATLAAVLIVAAVGALRFGEVATIWRTGATSRIAIATTFLATLALPIAAAVGVGVALSLLLQLNRDALDLTVVELVPRPDGRFEERPAPRRLPSGRVTLLDVYGSLLYAGARTLEARLPDPSLADRPVVVLRLRGRAMLGATFHLVVATYARQLERVGGRLYLSGLDHEVMAQLGRTGRIDVHGPIGLYEATAVVGESSEAAVHDAEAWLVGGAPPAAE